MSQIELNYKKKLMGELKILSKLASEMDSVYGRLLLRDDPRLVDNKRNLTVSIKHTFKKLKEKAKGYRGEKSALYKSIAKYVDKLDDVLDTKEWNPEFTPLLSELYNLVYTADTYEEE